MPKERFELSRAHCPLRPERSASASSATSACVRIYFIAKGYFVKQFDVSVVCLFFSSLKPNQLDNKDNSLLARNMYEV